MWRIWFLTLILFSSIAFAQTQEKPQAYKFDEFSSSVSGDVKVRIWHLQTELEKQPTSNGVIITYESIRNFNESKHLHEVVQRQYKFLRLDENKIKIIKGGYRQSYSVELWIVPQGAESPKPTSSIIKFNEFNRVSDEDFKQRVIDFCMKVIEKKVEEGKDYRCGIKIYGTTKQKRGRLKQMKEILNFVHIDSSLILLIDGGKRVKPKTEFWIVIPDAKTLTQNSQT